MEVNVKRTVIAAMALSLLAGSVAFADPPQGGDEHGPQQDRWHDEHRDGRNDWHRDDRHDREEHQYRGERHDRGDRHDRDERHYRDDHHDRDERHYRDEHRDRDEHRPPERGFVDFDSGRYRRPHGWYEHRWRRGERLPPDWRAGSYIIPDAARYHLRRPPPGYYWVRVDDNAVLTAAATGVIVSVALNLFH